MNLHCTCVCRIASAAVHKQVRRHAHAQPLIHTHTHLPPCGAKPQVANTRELQRAAWKAVAEAEGLPFPSMERPQLYDMRPERAAMDVSGNLCVFL